MTIINGAIAALPTAAAAWVVTLLVRRAAFGDYGTTNQNWFVATIVLLYMMS